MVGFEKALGAVKTIKDQIQYRSQSLLNLARGYFTKFHFINFINYDLCSGASTFTPFAVGCSILKKTDLILSYLYVKYFKDYNKYNNRIPWKV